MIVCLIVRFEGMIRIRGDGWFDMIVIVMGGRLEAGRVIRCRRNRGFGGVIMRLVAMPADDIIRVLICVLSESDVVRPVRVVGIDVVMIGVARMAVFNVIVRMLVRVIVVRVIFVGMIEFAGMIVICVILVGMIIVDRTERRRVCPCILLGRILDNGALHAFAVIASTRVAMPRTAAAGAIFRLFLRLAVCALVGCDQRLTVGDRNLIVVRMDFAERKEAVAISAVFDECSLQRRFDAGNLGQIDVTAQLFALSGFEIKFLDAVAADHHHPGFFRVGGVDQHFVGFVGHFEALGGGGRMARRAHLARPGNATVHLIRG
jgi:hypothetical protein